MNTVWRASSGLRKRLRAISSHSSCGEESLRHSRWRSSHRPNPSIAGHRPGAMLRSRWGDIQPPTHGGDAVKGPVHLDELEDRLDGSRPSRANHGVVFASISRSSRRQRFCRRRRRNASASAVVGLSVRFPSRGPAARPSCGSSALTDRTRRPAPAAHAPRGPAPPSADGNAGLIRVLSHIKGSDVHETGQLHGDDCHRLSPADRGLCQDLSSPVASSIADEVAGQSRLSRPAHELASGGRQWPIGR